jgi:hypothetical protein
MSRKDARIAKGKSIKGLSSWRFLRLRERTELVAAGLKYLA